MTGQQESGHLSRVQSHWVSDITDMPASQAADLARRASNGTEEPTQDQAPTRHPTTVFVWNNVSGLLGLRHPVLGHASITIGGDGTPGPHIGLWQDGVEDDLQEDVINQGYAPDHVISIDGLDTDRMRQVVIDEAWRKYKNNCATVVSKTLLSGTSTQVDAFVWTPLKVKRLAFQLGGKSITWKEYAEHRGFEEELSDWRKRSDGHGNPDIPARYVGGEDGGKNHLDGEEYDSSTSDSDIDSSESDSLNSEPGTSHQDRLRRD